MRIDEQGQVIESLKKENNALEQQYSKLDSECIFYKDKCASLSKAVIALSIISFIAVVFLIISNMHFTQSSIDSDNKISESQKLAEDAQTKLDDTSKEMESKENELTNMQFQFEEKNKDVENLTQKIEEMKHIIADKDKEIEDLRQKQKETGNKDYYEFR